MKTSNFWQYPTGHNRIVISRAVPPVMESGYQRYKQLAPGSWFKNPEYKNNLKDYRERYFSDILAQLNPTVVWEELHKLAGDKEPILLCWEPLKRSEEWCHRRIVAEWFEETLGMNVPEYVVDKKNQHQLELL